MKKVENFKKYFDNDGVMSEEGVRLLFNTTDVDSYFSIASGENIFGIDKGDVASFYCGFDNYVMYKAEMMWNEEYADKPDSCIDNSEDDFYSIHIKSEDTFVEYYNAIEWNPFTRFDFSDDNE